ncbi:MAG TPA: ABC transporter ATP-binding protein/permease [Beijerinckiaceae bacterium]|nr:ABC transporter ATP-binding protein/permease [Beijerinckiaceae bacterium]
MVIWSVLFGAGGLVLLALGAFTGAELPFYMPLSTIGMGAVLYLARHIPRFLRLFVQILAGTHALLLGLAVLEAAGLVPARFVAYIPPASMPVGATAFAFLIYGVSFVPVIATIMGIADRYFESRAASQIDLPLIGTVHAREGTIAATFLGILIAINLGQVALNVRLNFFSRDLFNSFQNQDAAAFWYQLLWVFVPLAAIFVGSNLIELWMQYVLRIRWRSYLNNVYVSEWLGAGTHYRMQLSGSEADNPDQRIAEDLRKYVDQTYSLSIGLLTQSATLVSFIVILWTVSRGFTLPGTDVPVPGLLVWIAILYALAGTYFTHKIGRPLIGLNFQQERFEADYRFSLARLREYGEQVALLDGERAEKERLAGRFASVVRNYMAIVRRYIKLTCFTASYFQANVVVPYLITAPYFFAGRITLGHMQQTVGAFNRVEAALTFFISAYTTLADYKAVVDRLTTFEASIDKARPPAEKVAVAQPHRSDELRLDNVTVYLPDGRPIVAADGIALRPGETTLLTGPSGSGKSTLFRAISGIWPFGEGRILTPDGASMMLLPQRPYIPVGTLRGAVAYPAVHGTYTDEAIVDALRAVRLEHLVDRLDEDRTWAQTLSIGEQQRLAVARALLARPDWLFLDEATAALDEPLENAIYRIIRERLPDTTVVSIGHRSTLHAFHDRRIDMRRRPDGLFAPVDLREAVPAE